MSDGYDAVVVGAGPNGLVGAVRLAAAGLKVLVLEQGAVAGGGMRTEELTLPGFRHDVCSTIHTLAGASPAFRALRLESEGVRWAHPSIALAHPLDDEPAALLHESVAQTATELGADAGRWTNLVGYLGHNGVELAEVLLDPLRIPRPSSAPVLARFGAVAALPASAFVKGAFRTERARALFGGLAAHSILDLRQLSSTGYGLFLGALAHTVGWPLAVGGSQAIADALVARLRSLGGEVNTGVRVRSAADIPRAETVLLDLTPRQVVQILGDKLPARYARRLGNYRYGPGVFKVDWALDRPVPWRDPSVADAGTLHLGGTFDEIAASERAANAGEISHSPFVLFVQPSVADRTRAPAGQSTAWAYCHVPNGSDVDMTDIIEAQVERFAPGFRDRILARHVMGPAALEAHNPNEVGGDIAGGAGDIRQYVSRPMLARAPWRTPLPGIYLASASTPPGGGVHGMGGWLAAACALKDRRIPLPVGHEGASPAH